jgi:hypothetical protein
MQDCDRKRGRKMRDHMTIPKSKNNCSILEPEFN